MEEIWKPIPNFEDYQVSLSGKIISYRTHKPKLLNGYIYKGMSCKKFTLQRKGSRKKDTASIQIWIERAFGKQIKELPSNDIPRKMIAIPVTPEFYREFRIYAARQNMTMAACARQELERIIQK